MPFPISYSGFGSSMVASRNTQKEVRSMASFANKLRMKQPNDTVASSIYKLPTPHNQAVEVPESHVHIGREQGTSIPLVMKKKPAVRIMTRNGNMLAAESTSHLTEVVEEKDAAGKSKDDWEVIYNFPAPSPIAAESSCEPDDEARRVSLARLSGTYDGDDDSPPPFMSKYEALHLNGERRREMFARRDQRQNEYLNRIGWKPADDTIHDTSETARPVDEVEAADAEQSHAHEQSPNDGDVAKVDLSDIVSVSGSKGISTAFYSPPAPPLSVYRQRVNATETARPFSKTFKTFFTRRRRLSGTDISHPIFETFRNCGPVDVNYVDGLHPDIKAIPIGEAQRRFGRAAQPEQATPDIINYFAEAKSSSESSDDRHEQPPQAVLAGCTKAKKASIVSRASRVTLFGDFIDLGSAEYSESEDAHTVIPAHPLRRKPGMISAWQLDKTLPPIPCPSPEMPEPMSPVPKPLRVASKREPLRTGKHVDTSKYDWLPPSTPRVSRASSSPQGSLSLPHRISSTNYTFDETTTVDDPFDETIAMDELFDEIDGQVAAMAIPDTARHDINKEAHRLKTTFERPPPGSLGVDDDDMEPTITLDMFVHNGHTSFVATERNGQMVYSDHRRFGSEQHDNREYEDDAAHRMEQLRRLRNGLEAADDNEWWVKKTEANEEMIDRT